MKQIQHIVVLLVICFICTANSHGQNDLTEKDKIELQQRVKLKVEEFQKYLSDIVNTELTEVRREESIQAALDLFIGKGKSYTVENDYGETEYRNPVRIQVSSINNDRTRWLPLTKYLANQYENVHKYGKVEIQSVDAVIIDNIKKTGDGQYQAVAYFCQKYISYRDGKLTYGPDITGKKVIVHISAIETPAGTVWDAKLGDIYVTSTKSDF